MFLESIGLDVLSSVEEPKRGMVFSESTGLDVLSSVGESKREEVFSKSIKLEVWLQLLVVGFLYSTLLPLESQREKTCFWIVTGFVLESQRKKKCLQLAIGFVLESQREIAIGFLMKVWLQVVAPVLKNWRYLQMFYEGL